MKLKVLSSSAKAYDAHHELWRGCTKCAIGHLAHFHVFARGQLPCDVLFIGEAPGKTENVIGEPFVGRAGKLLDEWVGSAMADCAAVQYGESSGKAKTCIMFTYAITNLTLCRPTNQLGGPNRAPTYREIENCRPRLEDFIINIARPRAVITLGNPARDNAPLPLFKRLGVPVFHLKHPAWVLRQGGAGSSEDEQERTKLTDILQKLVTTLQGGK